MRTVNVRKPRKMRVSRAMVLRLIDSPTIGTHRESPELFSARRSFSSIRSAHFSLPGPSELVRPGIARGPCRQYRKDQNKMQIRWQPPATTTYLPRPLEVRRLSPPV